MFYLKTVCQVIMSIQLISTHDGITVNETLKDDITIYEYINKVVNLLGDDVSIIMIITVDNKMITIKIK
jgi:hypothetical protein